MAKRSAASRKAPKRSTLNVSLTPKVAKIIQDRVKSGEYASSSEVVRKAIVALVSLEKEQKRFWAEVDKGLKSLEEGRTVDGQKFMDDWRRRNLERRRQLRKSA